MKNQLDVQFIFAMSVFMSQRMNQLMQDYGLPPTGPRAENNLAELFFNWIRDFEAQQVEAYGADRRFIKGENDNIVVL